MREAFVETLLEEAKKDENIILITGDLGFGVLDNFHRELPNQFINSGVNEQSMMGMAAGIASTGKRVFVYSIGNFPTLRCLEQIRNDICLMNNSVVVVSVGAGYSYGPQGYTHHALEDIAVMRSLPNIDVVVPSDPIETKLVTKLLANSASPSYLRLGKSNEKQIFNNDLKVLNGKFNEVISGDSGTILFVGSVGTIAVKAAEELKKLNISVSVASALFVSNLDATYINLAARKGPIISLEENSIRGGFGSALLEFLNTNRITANVGLVASNQHDLSQIGDQDFLRISNGISVDEVINKFKALLEV
jgi:transketolase